MAGPHAGSDALFGSIFVLIGAASHIESAGIRAFPDRAISFRTFLISKAGLFALLGVIDLKCGFSVGGADATGTGAGTRTRIVLQTAA